jgi:hypothetical protein
VDGRVGARALGFNTAWHAVRLQAVAGANGQQLLTLLRFFLFQKRGVKAIEL